MHDYVNFNFVTYEYTTNILTAVLQCYECNDGIINSRKIIFVIVLVTCVQSIFDQIINYVYR